MREKSAVTITYVEYMPLVRRLLHWLLVLAVTGDLVSGLFLNLSPEHTSIRSWRLVHGLSSWTLISLFLVYSYVFAVTGWWREWLPTLEDVKHTWRFFKYVIYLQYRYKQQERYNPGQKVIYFSWVLVFLLMIITGIGLFFGEELKFIEAWLHGLQGLRWLHFLGTVYLLVTLQLHVYLAFAEDPARLAAMFCGVIRNKVQ